MSEVGMGNTSIIMIIMTMNCHDIYYHLISKHRNNRIIKILLDVSVLRWLRKLGTWGNLSFTNYLSFDQALSINIT